MHKKGTNCFKTGFVISWLLENTTFNFTLCFSIDVGLLTLLVVKQ